MKKILKDCAKTTKILNKCPRIYIVATWAHPGYRWYYYAGWDKKRGTPLVYDYYDGNGTTNIWRIVPISYVTTGVIHCYTFSHTKAKWLAEQLNIAERYIEEVSKE